MPSVNHFYNATTRKYVALFGTLFNEISITRDDENGVEQQKMIVPIAYGPAQKFLSRITEDPNLDRPFAMTLPRMAFEINGMVFDPTRKLPSTQKIRKIDPESNDARGHIWSATPYNIDFSLFVMTKYSEDAVKIVEQIVPFFMPEWTTTVKLIDGLEPLDIPLVLSSVSNEELYEGNYEERRAVLWTLNFTMKCWYFGPERQRKVIKFVESSMHTDTDVNSSREEKISVYPGLTTDGEPTSDPTETISYQDIEFDMDWGVITVIEEEPDDG